MLGKEGCQVDGQGWMAVQQLLPVGRGALCFRLQVGRDHFVQPGITGSERICPVNHSSPRNQRPRLSLV